MLMSPSHVSAELCIVPFVILLYHDYLWGWYFCNAVNTCTPFKKLSSQEIRALIFIHVLHSLQSARVSGPFHEIASYRFVRLYVPSSSYVDSLYCKVYNMGRHETTVGFE